VNTADIIALTEKYQMSNYSRFPVAFVRGEGARLFDADGREYLDFLGGIAVALLGHAHPDVTRAVSVQARASCTSRTCSTSRSSPRSAASFGVDHRGKDLLLQ
jgi:acetylornithine/succinyldiaminopimelate/putrescine aminotransferase